MSNKNSQFSIRNSSASFKADSQLPSGWSWVKLGDVCEFNYGKGLTKKNRNEKGRFPVYGSNGIVGYHDNYLIEGPCLIIGRKGAAGEVHISMKNCWPIDTTYFVRSNSNFSPIFLYYILKELRLYSLDKSTAIPGLNRNDAYKLLIPLPPLPVQHKIVEKIEELFSELDSGVANLRKAIEQIKTYRQSVLAYAFSGKLTNGHPELVSGFEKLNQVQLDNSLLPNGWKWVKLGEVTELLSGYAFKKAEYSKSGVRLFQIANVSFNKIVWDEIEYLPLDYLSIDKYKNLILEENDIVMALNRPLLKDNLKIGQIRNNDCPSILYQRVGKFTLNEKIISKYILYFLQTTFFINWLKEELQGINIPFINKSKLLNFEKFPLAPIEKQLLIVSEIERRFSVADKLEQTIDESLEKAEQLKQSILKKAFEGRLV